MSFENFIHDHFDSRTTSRSDMIRICCPFCGDSKFHGYVNIEKGLYKCFKCKFSHKPDGEATTAYYFLKAFGIPPGEIFKIIVKGEDSASTVDPVLAEADLVKALDEFFSRATIGEIYLSENELKSVVPICLPDGCRPITKDSNSVIGRIAYQYIQKRFHNADSILQTYPLHYGYTGQYFGYIIIPVYEWGNLVWYQGRAFFPPTKQPKYLGPSQTTKPIFGIDLLHGKAAILCEGVFDAMTLGAGALCPFGSSLSKRQIEVIRSLELDAIILYFDWDGAGRDGMLKTGKQLKEFIPYVYVVMNAVRDANSLGTEEAYKFIDNNMVRFDTKAEVALKLG